MLTTLLSFILVLGFLVFVHELGHYLAARHVGVKVERFSIGFPPKAIGRTVGETEYVLSWIPLGGYVKLFGQNIDDEDPADPRNYASKTKWQRAYILVAGPAMNLVAALALMALVYMIGVETPAYRFSAPRLYAVEAGSPAETAGLRAGDRLTAVDGKAVESWQALYDGIEEGVIHGRPLTFTVARGPATLDLDADSDVFAAGKPFGWQPVIPPLVGEFGPDSPARAAGLERGDVLTAIDGRPVRTWSEVPDEIQRSEGRPLAITVQRGGAAFTYTVTPRHDPVRNRWLIDIALATHSERHGPLASVRLGGERLVNLTKATFLFLGRMLTGSGSLDALGGPVKIASVVGEAARSSVSQLVFLMAFISLQLGIFNLLPIPALDGGHIFMLGVEALNRGPLSPRVRERTQMIGLSLLILLILVVTYNDVMQMFSFGATG